MRRRRGQGLTEYVIVVGVLAIGMIAAVKGLGRVLERSYGKVTGAVEDLGLELGRGGRGGPGASAASRRALKVRSCPHPADEVDHASGRCGECGRDV